MNIVSSQATSSFYLTPPCWCHPQQRPLTFQGGVWMLLSYTVFAQPVLQVCPLQLCVSGGMVKADFKRIFYDLEFCLKWKKNGLTHHFFRCLYFAWLHTVFVWIHWYVCGLWMITTVNEMVWNCLSRFFTGLSQHNFVSHVAPSVIFWYKVHKIRKIGLFFSLSFFVWPM